MNKKSVREMGRLERRRHSLTTRMIIALQLLALAVGITVLIAGFALYYMGILYEYTVSTSQMAKAVSVVLDPKETKAKTDEILSIYDSIPEDEKTDAESEEYQAAFDPVLDEDFRNIQERMREIKKVVGLRNAFIAAICESDGRMIYLVDSDPDPETFCQPGTWDTYTHDEVSVLVHGREATNLEKRIGMSDRPQATITNTEKYGLRCTGGATLYETDQYSVMVCLDEKLNDTKEISMVFLSQYIILLLAVLFLVGLVAFFLIRHSMVKPIKRLAEAARSYSEDKKQGSTEADHFRDLGLRKGDEIEELNLTMADMEDTLTEYVENLTKVTAERERIATELDLAARIQTSALPSTFPAYPERSDFDIFAGMDPAREVGGDFYNFFLIDDDHLALTIADVSGKGIPAALFMMVSKSLLDSKILEALSPAEALKEVNDAICEDNNEDMFVTVWLGVLELSTGRIIAANAGHERPIIIHPDGSVELIRDKHGFVIGGMEGMKYKDYELQLEPGAMLLVYTDGVPEATSKDMEIFSTGRIVETIEGFSRSVMQDDAVESAPRETVLAVKHAVDEFVGEAEQFDDLTMLCVQWFGKGDVNGGTGKQ